MFTSSFCRTMCSAFPHGSNQMDARATVVGLVTPHLLKIIDLAEKAESGVFVEPLVGNAVNATIRELADQYNVKDLLLGYVEGLESVAEDAGPSRKAFAGVLKSAAAIAARDLARLD